MIFTTPADDAAVGSCKGTLGPKCTEDDGLVYRNSLLIHRKLPHTQRSKLQEKGKTHKENEGKYTGRQHKNIQATHLKL